MKKFSTLIYDNDTGELLSCIESENITFEVQKNPNFTRTWREPEVEIHTHTKVDRYINFEEGTLYLSDFEDRDPKLDRIIY